MANSDGPRLTALGWVFIALVVSASLYGASRYLPRNRAPGGVAPASPDGSSAATPAGKRNGTAVRVGIAYGTEKKLWLEWAAAEFAKTPEGAGIQIDLLPLGSIEAAQAILGGDERIQVWSPASSVYRGALVEDWKVRQVGGEPIASEENLALTPMVVVMWGERYQAFAAKYKEVSFRTLGEALAEKGGWATIAGRPDWGLFKFGHTHPNQSNSGLLTLTLMAYDFHGKSRGLELKDILDGAFQDWLGAFERAVSGLTNSTGNLMREMVLKGPSTYDAVMVYESVAIDYLKNAEGRWGEIRVIYPERNMWNENPYYVLRTPWVSAAQQAAAGQFRAFLLSRPVQERSLEHGFRPADPAVAIRTPESPFTRFASSGLQVEVATACEPPRGEVIQNLLAGWQRSAGSR